MLIDTPGQQANDTATAGVIARLPHVRATSSLRRHVRLGERAFDSWPIQRSALKQGIKIETNFAHA